MVSLNEKRSKIRYVVQNKTEWVDDGNKFGKKMLEKMGWTSGVGLGKNEDGRTEHIDLKFKANLKGVGFINGKYDDTWISHSQSFDSVLQQLQRTHSTPSASSLHNFNQTVQQTKTRFTYKKQSSGKDLSSRSNNELECIFGWNKNTNQIKEQSHIDDIEEKEEKKNEKISDNLYVTSKQSIHDYFKEKSRKKTLQQSLNNQQNNSVDESLSNDPINEDIEKTSLKRKKKKQNQDIEEINFNENEKIKKQKRDDLMENPYPNSNLFQLEGYQGWNIDSTFEEILKKKEKQKKRKK